MRPLYEVADVVRDYGDQYRHERAPTPAQDKVLKHLATCRTAVLGGHVDRCVECGHQRPSYNSCRDRHCPKCQASRREAWLEQRQARVLPVKHFHVVFTLPSALHSLVLGNKRLLYDMLFQAASQTLKQLAKDPKHLGAQLGFTAVLHTWGQQLSLHPHLHCVVTGGGLAHDGRKWVRGRRGYFLPVRVLAKLFRGKFLAKLQQAWQQNQLQLAGSTEQLQDPAAWKMLKDRLYRTDWVVYAKHPFGGTKQVFAYLGRYTHRVAITNHRLKDYSDGRVTFSYRDYADHRRTKMLQLNALEFMRRFLLHVLPKGFSRIRHYGLYAGSNVGTKLRMARRLLEPQRQGNDDVATLPMAAHIPLPVAADLPWWERFRLRTGIDVMVCPRCAGQLRPHAVVNSGDAPARAPPEDP